MQQATETIAESFHKHELYYDTVENERSSYVSAGFRTSVGTNADVWFITPNGDNSVSVRAFSLATVPEDRVDQILSVLNQVNERYRFFKFVMDEDREIRAEYDLPRRTENVGEVAFDTFMLAMQIINEAMPLFMKAIWG